MEALEESKGVQIDMNRLYPFSGLSIYEELIDKKTSLAVVGLGYVGMPIAVAFAKRGILTIGFDVNQKKIELYRSGMDPTKEVGDDAIRSTQVQFKIGRAHV